MTNTRSELLSIFRHLWAPNYTKSAKLLISFMNVLGLDVSTANIGVCLLTTEGAQSPRALLAYGIHLTKIKGLYTKACEFREHIQKIKKLHKIDMIVIEESLQAFRSKKSSAGVISKLNRFNGIISYITRSELGVPVHLANVVSTRKSVGCAIDRKSKIDTKSQVLAWVKDQPELASYVWPTKVMKSGPDKGKTRDEVICFDIADAYVVALFGIQHLKINELDLTML